MKTVYVLLAGGLENQMFQAAAGYAYMKYHGQHRRVICCTRHWTAHQGAHPLSYESTVLCNFSLSEQEIPSDAVKINENNFYDVITHDKDVVLEGYFQSKYFIDPENSHQHKQLFIRWVKQNTITKQENTIGVHIRKGDYNIFPKFQVCGPDYFGQAVSIIGNMVSKPQTIVLYSDTPEEASVDLTKITNCGFCFRVSQTPKADDALRMMISGHPWFVGCNSTLSWWASELGSHLLSFAPAKWFTDDEGEYTNLIYHNWLAPKFLTP